MRKILLPVRSLTLKRLTPCKIVAALCSHVAAVLPPAACPLYPVVLLFQQVLERRACPAPWRMRSRYDRNEY